MTRMSALCFVDVETDGLHHNCKAWEVAVIRRDSDGETAHSWMLPLDLRHADPFALNVGGFWDRHPVGRKVSGKEPVPGVVTPVHDVAKEVMRLTFGATLIGSAVHFDADVLARMLRSEGYLPSWSHRLRCVTTLASGAMGRDVGGLDGAREAAGLPPLPGSDRHTAMGDAIAAAGIWDHFMDGAQR